MIEYIFSPITAWGVCFFGIGAVSALLTLMFEPCVPDKINLSSSIYILSLISAGFGCILIILGMIL
jgi:hypothetical protein